MADHEASVNAHLKEVTNLPLIKECLDDLTLKLPQNLYYHSVAHTYDVLHEAILFALHDQLPPSEIILLSIAASFHDAGFLTRYQQNEKFGANMAMEAMKKSNTYSPKEMKTVYQMILDTQVRRVGEFLVQVPKTRLSRYLLDADLSNLGRDDIFEKSELIAQELASFNLSPPADGGLQIVAGKKWFTHAAKTLREAKHKENLVALTFMQP